jgi:hypothetical protein
LEESISTTENWAKCGGTEPKGGGREILTPRRAGIETQADVKTALLMSEVREADA